MTSGSQSKAQRRAENQRRAEERAAPSSARSSSASDSAGSVAPRRHRARGRPRPQLTGGGDGACRRRSRTRTSPSSPSRPPCRRRWIQPPAGTPGPETVPVPTGPKLATLINAATGQTVNGVQCQAGEQLVVHVHTHLTIFVNGKHQVIPYGIGIPGFAGRQHVDGPVRRDRELLLLAARARRRRDHPHRVAQHHDHLHARPVLRRVGQSR